jgi:formylglycine-generating enzyme required for sulfatase activity
MFVRSLPYWKVLGVALLCLAVEPVMGQAQAAAKKPPPACKGSSRVGWNNCVGTYTTTEGALYVGEFRNGKYNGQGTATWPNGDRYIGEFRDDKFHGQGVYTSEKNFTYAGDFRDGMFNGVGTYTSSNGMKYVGEWRDDEKNGQGTYTWPSGRVYVGQFRDDEREGQGSDTQPDGSKYVGEFRESKRWGTGTLYDTAGRMVQSGVWREDRFQGAVADVAPAAVAAAAPVALAPAPAAAPIAAVATESATRTMSAEPSSPTASAPASSNLMSMSAAAMITALSGAANAAAPPATAAAPATNAPSANATSSAPPAAVEASAVAAPTDATASNGGLTDSRGPARVALVVGNQNYSNVSSLRNARADAEAMATALDNLGFEVLLRMDLDDRALRQAMRDFKLRLDGGSEAVFFYAGHGVQLGAANYLLPTNIAADNEEQVKDDAVMLQRVLDDLAEQKVRFSVAIIDACRDNPFPKVGTRSIGGTRGLAPTTAATGQMILFSAGTGQTALDYLTPTDPDPNGLFTRVLLREMTRPGVPVDQMLKRARQEVVSLAKSVGHEQVPALYDQTVGEFYFTPAVAGGPAARAPEAAAQPQMLVAALPTDDRALWESVRDSKNPEEIQAYLSAFPQGLFAGVATARLRSLQGGGGTSAPATTGSNGTNHPANAPSPTSSSTASTGAAATGSTVSDLQQLGAGTVFRDCPDCPEMIVVPPGKFEMGLADYRKARRPNEGPVRTVNIPGTFAIGKHEVTWSQYARFVRETSRAGGLGCATFNAKKFRVNAQAAWNSPGFPQTENDPVVCISWDDAKAYAEWLGVRTGHNYRLITEAEWEYVVRAGTTGDRFWGENPADACRFANVADATGRGTLGLEAPFDCRDRHAGTAPVGSFQSNPFGVHDLFGNAEEWILDCWSDTYRNAPTSGIADTSGDCDRRVVRGGSWFDGADVVRATARGEDAVGARSSTRGFRIARTN